MAEPAAKVQKLVVGDSDDSDDDFARFFAPSGPPKTTVTVATVPPLATLMRVFQRDALAHVQRLVSELVACRRPRGGRRYTALVLAVVDLASGWPADETQNVHAPGAAQCVEIDEDADLHALAATKLVAIMRKLALHGGSGKQVFVALANADLVQGRADHDGEDLMAWLETSVYVDDTWYAPDKLFAAMHGTKQPALTRVTYDGFNTAYRSAGNSGLPFVCPRISEL
jgi:hypothetical protein